MRFPGFSEHKVSNCQRTQLNAIPLQLAVHYSTSTKLFYFRDGTLNAIQTSPIQVERAPEGLVRTSQAGILFGSSNSLTPEQITALVSAFHQQAPRGSSVLGGRNALVMADIPDIGSVAIKNYARGGLLRHFNHRTYLKDGPIRSEVEYRMLKRAQNVGVAVPEPIAFAVEGNLFYRAWLVTKEIEGGVNLAELSRRDEDTVLEYSGKLVDYVIKLIEHKIFHVDLHPGNVIVDPKGSVFLADFDKSHEFVGSKRELRDRYLTRWRRAVIKHELSDVLSEAFCLGLRRPFDG